MTGREKCLKTASEKVTQIKDKVYGRPEFNLSRIAKLWTLYLNSVFDCNIRLTPSDVALMMALFKIARIMGGTEVEDSYIDACGYLACAYECEIGDSDETEN